MKEKPVEVPEPNVSPLVCGVDATVATGLPNGRPPVLLPPKLNPPV